MFKPSDISYCGHYNHILSFTKPATPAIAVLLTDDRNKQEHLFVINDAVEWCKQSSEMQFNLLKSSMLGAGVRNVGTHTQYRIEMKS